MYYYVPGTERAALVGAVHAVIDEVRAVTDAVIDAVVGAVVGAGLRTSPRNTFHVQLMTETQQEVHKVKNVKTKRKKDKRPRGCGTMDCKCIKKNIIYVYKNNIFIVIIYVADVFEVRCSVSRKTIQTKISNRTRPASIVVLRRTALLKHRDAQAKP